MTTASDTAVVMSVHDGEPFLKRQIDSILDQTLLPAVLTIVDDASTDGSRELIRKIARTASIPVELVTTDGSSHRNRSSRITASVMRGLGAVTEFELVLLSDQDDEWLPARLALQREILNARTEALLVAGDALLIDGHGAAIEGSLRDLFPAPDGWDAMSAAQRVRAAIDRPFVTGATVALRRDLVKLMAPVPAGWLLDRWATIAAASRGGLMIQRDPVIRYRLHPTQAVGVRAAMTGPGRRRWRQVLERGASPLEGLSRARDVVHRIRPLAVDDAVGRELSWGSMIRASLRRADAQESRSS